MIEFQSYRMQAAAEIAAWLSAPERSWAPQSAAIKPCFDEELENVVGTQVSVVLAPRNKGNVQRVRGECRLTLLVVVARKITATDELGKLREIDDCLTLVDSIEDELLRAENRNFGEWLLLELDAEGDEREPFSDGYIRSLRQFNEAIPLRLLRVE